MLLVPVLTSRSASAFSSPHLTVEHVSSFCLITCSNIIRLHLVKIQILPKEIYLDPRAICSVIKRHDYIRDM